MKALVTNTIIGLAVLLMLVGAGCSGGEKSDPTNPDTAAQFLPPGATEPVTGSATIDGHSLELQCYLWRDFMPIVVDDPDPAKNSTALRAHLKVIAVDSSDIESDLDMDYLWLIQGDNVFERELTGDKRPAGAYVIEKGISGGPLWETGSTADVIVRVVNAEGDPAYLRLNNQVISRTE